MLSRTVGAGSPLKGHLKGHFGIRSFLQPSASSGSSSATKHDEKAFPGSFPSAGAILLDTSFICSNHLALWSASASFHRLLAVSIRESICGISACFAASGSATAPLGLCRRGLLSLISKNQPDVLRPSRNAFGLNVSDAFTFNSWRACSMTRLVKSQVLSSVPGPIPSHSLSWSTVIDHPLSSDPYQLQQ